MKRSVFLVLILLVCLISGAALAQSSGAISLSGNWKFAIDPTNVGRQKGWYAANFDASSWKTITVPGDWESQGFRDSNSVLQQADDLNQPYTGYAWYRRSVIIPAEWQGRSLVLDLGSVDDMDWTYFNGTLIGSTTQRGDRWVSGIQRSYAIPVGLVKYGKPNVIAVQVLDMRGLGGIMGNNVAIRLGEPSAVQVDGKDRVQVGNDVQVKAGEYVNDAVTVMGDLEILGTVRGDAVAVMGDIHLYPGSRVDGDVVCVGGKITRDEGVDIGGQVVSAWGSAPSFNRPRLPFCKGSLPGWVGTVASLMLVVISALFAALIAALLPTRTELVAEVVGCAPGWSAIYGIFAILLIVPVAVLLTITCVGIPLIAVEMLLLAAAWIVGSVAVSLLVGRKITGAIGRPIASPALASFIGAILIGLVEMIPVAWIVSLLLTLLGFGAVWITGFGASRDWFAGRFGGRPVAPPSQP